MFNVFNNKLTTRYNYKTVRSNKIIGNRNVILSNYEFYLCTKLHRGCKLKMYYYFYYFNSFI